MPQTDEKAELFTVNQCQLPDKALLNKYTQSGAYTDCFQTEIGGSVTHAEFVTAFYTTCLFKLERVILKWAISKPSSDKQAQQLAQGSIDCFAAWQVEGRCEDQLLLSDFQGRTRSWFMVIPVDFENSRKTRLLFGSAVVLEQGSNSAGRSKSTGFSMLLLFHRIYSVLLLYAARHRLNS